MFSLAMNRASTTKSKEPHAYSVLLHVGRWKVATEHHVFNKWFVGPFE